MRVVTLLLIGPTLGSVSIQGPESGPSSWVECADCAISITVERTIASAPSDPFGLAKGDAMRLAFTPDGDVWVASRIVGHALAKFDAGGILDIFLDREGDGPGEYRWIRGIDTHGGTLTVMGGDRVARHDWLDGAIIDTRRLNLAVFRFLALPNGNVVVNGTSGQPGRAGHPLHVVDSIGRILASVGPQTAGLGFDRVNSTLTLGVAPGGAFWVGRMNRYRLDKYSSDGSHLGSIEREVEWFEPWETFVDVRRGRPNSQVGGLLEDDDGRLWVLIWVGDDRDGPSDDFVGPRDVQGPVDTTWDTIIEVLDARSGEVIASRRLPQYVHGFVNGRIVGFDRGDDGGQELVVMIPRLVH